MGKLPWYNWVGDELWNEYCKAGTVIIGICLLLIGLLVGAIL